MPSSSHLPPPSKRPHRARRRFGQHFLHEKRVLARLVEAIAPAPGDFIVEIGPGEGALTTPLLEKCGSLQVIEVDRDLAAALDADTPDNVTVVTGDVLAVDLEAVVAGWLGTAPGPDRQIRVVGNLPYNISSPILFKLLAVAARTRGVRDALLMLQKEVADRLVAPVGTGDYGVLTVLTTLHADVTRVLSLPPGAFRPPPKHPGNFRVSLFLPYCAVKKSVDFVADFGSNSCVATTCHRLRLADPMDRRNAHDRGFPPTPWMLD